MESNDTKQSQGAVSAPGESPKDVNQNTYTDEETSLAAKYRVEPKLIRMISEIVGEHTSEITQLIDLSNGKKGQEAETQDQPEQEAENKPNTGIPTLDHYIENLSLEAKVAVCGTLDLICKANDTGDKIREYLRGEVAVFDDFAEIDKITCMDTQTITECQWYLGFVKGAEIGLQEA